MKKKVLAKLEKRGHAPANGRDLLNQEDLSNSDRLQWLCLVAQTTPSFKNERKEILQNLVDATDWLPKQEAENSLRWMYFFSLDPPFSPLRDMVLDKAEKKEFGPDVRNSFVSADSLQRDDAESFYKKHANKGPARPQGRQKRPHFVNVSFRA